MGPKQSRCPARTRCRNRSVGLLLLSALLSVDGRQATVKLYRNSPVLDSDPQRARNNQLIYGQIGLGTPNQNFTTCFDTGSVDLWLPSADCHTASCTSHNQFYSGDSTTFNDTPNNFVIDYSLGQVTGEVAIDVLVVGAPPFIVHEQAFGLATNSTADFTENTCDGVFGLAPPAMGRLKNGQNAARASAFYKMVHVGVLDQPVFTIWMDGNMSKEVVGQLTFGGINPKYYNGALVQMPTNNPKYWSVPMRGVSIGGAPVATNASYAILDSGTRLIIASDADAQAINAGIKGLAFDRAAGSWALTAGCFALSALPTIELRLGDFVFPLTPDQYIVQVGSANASGCFSSIVGGGPAAKIVLGDNFLRAYFSVYTYDDKSGSAWISLAPSNGNATGRGQRAQLASSAANANSDIVSPFGLTTIAPPTAQPVAAVAPGQAAPPNTVSAADLNKPPQAPGVPGVGSGQGASPAVPAIATGRPDVAAASVPSVAGAAPPGPR